MPLVARLFLLLYLGSGPCLAQSLHIATLDDPPSRAVALQLRQAYARLGLELKPEVMPLRRAAHLLARHELDGELMRAAVYFEQHPHALKVDVPLAAMPVWAHRRPPCPVRVSLVELARAPVVYERGVLAIERLLPEAARVPAAWGSDVHEMLRRGRAEYSLTVATPSALAELEQGSAGLCRVPEPVAQVQLFHVLHARHQALRPQLEQALRELQAAARPLAR